MWGWFELRTLERDKDDFDTDNYVITANETLTIVRRTEVVQEGNVGDHV